MAEQFDPDAYLAEPAEAFDPDAYLKEGAHEQLPNEGFGAYLKRTLSTDLKQVPKTLSDIATQPLADHIPLVGALGTRAAGGAIGMISGDEAKQKFFNEDAARRQKFAQENPNLNQQMDIAGGFAIPMVGAGPVTRTLGQVGMTGAEYGLRGQDPVEAMKASGKSQAALEAALAVAHLPKTMAGIAGNRSTKAVTGNSEKATKQMFKSGMLELEDGHAISPEFGQKMLTADEAGPAVNEWGDNAYKIKPKTAAKRDYYGKKIGEVAEGIDSIMHDSVSGENIAQKLRDRADSMVDSNTTDGAKRLLYDEADRLEKRGHMGFKDAQKYKDTYPWHLNDDDIMRDTKNFLKMAVGDEMEQTARLLADSAAKDNHKLADLLGSYERYKKEYGDYAFADEAAGVQVTRKFKNRQVTPTSHIAAVLGAAATPSHGAIGGLVAGAANHMMLGHGSASGAVAADRIAKVLQSTPEVFGKFRDVLEAAALKGNQSLALTHYLLMKKDPEYQQMMSQ